MGSFRLESVLIGNVVHGVHLAIITSVGVRSSDHQRTDIVSEVLQLSFLLTLEPVAGVEAVQ